MQDGRRGAKAITKRKVRRHERDADHDLARRYNAGDRTEDDGDE